MKDLIKISNKFPVNINKNCYATPKEVQQIEFLGWFAHQVWGNPYIVLQFEVTKGNYKNMKLVFHVDTKITFCHNRFHRSLLCKSVIALLNRDLRLGEIINLDELIGSTCLAIIEMDSNNKVCISQLLPNKYKKLVKKFIL